MTTTAYFRGYKIIWNEEKRKWFYEDTGKLAGFDGDIRPCKKCGKIFEGSNKSEPDPCLGNLPGVDNACCGHGEKGYIRFTNGVVIRGIFEIEKPPQDD